MSVVGQHRIGPLGLTAALALALASPGWASVRTGIEAWAAGEYEKAVAAWTPLARQGDADAAFNLGQAHRLGRGVPVDLAKAQQWFEQAARKGHVDAQTSLGLLLFQSGNRVAGVRWLKSAAQAGEARAMLIYGTALFNGDGVPRDAVAAYAFVSRAAAQGLAPARSTLTDMDEILPLEARQKGLAMAQKMAGVRATGAKPAPAAKLAAKPQPSARPAPPKAAPPAKSDPRPEPAPAKAAAGSGWRIQLGAFSQKSAAEGLFARLRGAGPVAGRQAYYTPVGKMVRLQVGPFGRDEAAAACKALSARGQGCFPVKAD